MFNRRQIVLASSLLAMAPITHAQQYPVKPITLIYNYAPGGPGDAVARYVAKQMGIILGQPVVVINRSGGAGSVGILAVAHARADGYTILYAPVTGVVQVPLVTKDASFDPITGLKPIVGIGVSPLAILAQSSLQINDFPSFVEWARKQPSGVNVAGAGPIIEVVTALLAREAKLKLVYVGYRGAAPALQAVLAGDVNIYLNTPSAQTAEFIKEGKLKVIGVTSTQPSPLFPGGEPISKYVPGFVQEINFAMWAPPGIPADIAAKLSDALRRVLAEPGTNENFFSNGLMVKPKSAEEIIRIAQRDNENIRKILETTPVKFGE